MKNIIENNIDYSYNSSGDRLSKTENTNTTNYNYLTNSHHLNSLSGSTTSSFTYDDNGNTVDNDNKDYTYNNANRLIGFTDTTQNYSYYINPLGQRIKKTNNNNSISTYYVYDAFDRLIAEYDENDNLLNEYIYLNSNPIALRRNNNIYYIYPDDLGTPRHITDASNNPKWSWDNIEPFGNNTPNETISGSTFKFNLRFPGQYYDEESGLSYNFYRDYNSSIGRYNESDPIGLSGGINTYAYVENNSLSFVDFFGLEVFNLLDPKDKLYGAATKEKDEPNVCLIMGHGDTNYVDINKSAYGFNPGSMTDSGLAKFILRNCKPKQIVKIMACEAGDGLDSIAAKVSKLVPNTIVAPDAPIWGIENNTRLSPIPYKRHWLFFKNRTNTPGKYRKYKNGKEIN